MGILQRNIENLIQHHFSTIVVNIHHFGDQVIRFLMDHAFDAAIYVSDERGCLMDTGGGIIQALPFFHDSPAVLVHNVDIISDVPLADCYDRFLSSDDDAWLLTQDRDTTRKLLFDEQQQLIGWKNKTDGQFKWTLKEKESYKELLSVECIFLTLNFSLRLAINVIALLTFIYNRLERIVSVPWKFILHIGLILVKSMIFNVLLKH